MDKKTLIVVIVAAVIIVGAIAFVMWPKGGDGPKT